MRITLVTVLAAAALLSGCQTPSQKAPQGYRFGQTDGHSICLVTEPAHAQFLSLQVRAALEDKGFEVKEVSSEEARTCSPCVRFIAKLGDWTGPRIESATLQYTHVAGGTRTTVSAESPGTRAAFGAPIDDTSVLVRTLVDRLFPNPIPWNGD